MSIQITQSSSVLNPESAFVINIAFNGTGFFKKIVIKDSFYPECNIYLYFRHEVVNGFYQKVNATTIAKDFNKASMGYTHIGSIPNGSGDGSSIPGQVIPKTQIMVPDAALLNTLYYKIRRKGKVEQTREWSIAFPNT